MKDKKRNSKASDERSAPQLSKRLLSSRRDVLPDAVTKHYAELGVKLTICMIEAEESDTKPMVVIEGDQTSLVFLADLLLAQAADIDCGYQLGIPLPKFFSQRSEYGLYIHKLPCTHERPGEVLDDGS